MFGWLKPRKTTAAGDAGATLSTQVVPSVAPQRRHAETSTAAAAAPRSAKPYRLPSRLTGGSCGLPPKGYKEPAPAAGMIAVEIAPPRVRTAVVVRVLADGRRVVARIGGTARTCCYTRRVDGTYRLESAPRAKAPRLVLGLDPLAPG